MGLRPPGLASLGESLSLSETGSYPLVVTVMKQSLEGSTPSGAIAIELPPSLVDVLTARLAELVSARLDGQAIGKRWIDTDEAAGYLSMSKKRLYTQREKLGIPSHKHGSLLLFDRIELDQWASRLGPDG
jgi:excisionase family DNA binding protein